MHTGMNGSLWASMDICTEGQKKSLRETARGQEGGIAHKSMGVLFANKPIISFERFTVVSDGEATSTSI
jgi:hypothetical protein